MASRVFKAEVARKLAPCVRSSLRVLMPKFRTSDEDGMGADGGSPGVGASSNSRQF